jgi:hypothetical protein
MAGGHLVEAVEAALAQLGDKLPPGIKFCCADCRLERRRARLKPESGQVMGVAFRVDDRWFWGNTQNHNFRERGINRRVPLDAHTEPVAMDCQVASHPPRPRFPEWIISRAVKALAGGHMAVHL